MSRYIEFLKEKKFYRQAWDVLEQAAAKDPDNTSLKADLIRVDSQIGGLDGAILRAGEFAKKDRDNSIYARVCAELYDQSGAPMTRSHCLGGRRPHGLRTTILGYPSTACLDSQRAERAGGRLVKRTTGVVANSR